MSKYKVYDDLGFKVVKFRIGLEWFSVKIQKKQFNKINIEKLIAECRESTTVRTFDLGFDDIDLSVCCKPQANAIRG